jgi:hypothetical protein
MTSLCTPEGESLRRWQDSSSDIHRRSNESATRVEMARQSSLFHCFGASDCFPRVLFGEFGGARSSVARWDIGIFSRLLLRASTEPSFYSHCFRAFNVSSRQLVKTWLIITWQVAPEAFVLMHVTMINVAVASLHIVANVLDLCQQTFVGAGVCHEPCSNVEELKRGTSDVFCEFDG